MLPQYPIGESKVSESRLALELQKVAWKMRAFGLFFFSVGIAGSIILFVDILKGIPAVLAAIQGFWLVRASSAFKQAANENLEEPFFEAIKSLNVFFIIWAIISVVTLITSVISSMARHG